MKILIYGSKGWIGSQLIEILTQHSVEFVEGISRVDNIHNVKVELQQVQPTHVISFIGRTHGYHDNKNYSTIDYLEQKGKLKENINDNLFSPVMLGLLCKEFNIHYTYLGTGCIFSYDTIHKYGSEDLGFIEKDEANFFGSSYSVVKGFTEKMLAIQDNVLILRIRMPITNAIHSRNFITKIVNYEKICSIPNSMSVLTELLPYIIPLLQQKTTGILNFTNPGLITHNEILDMYKEIVDPSFTWKNFNIEEQQKVIACERSNNCLDTTRLLSLFPEIKPIKESVRTILGQYKENVLVKKSSNNLLITGGSGFIGSNFINYYFFKKDHGFSKIVNLDAMYYCAKEENVYDSIRKNPNYVFQKGNLNDYELLQKILVDNNITHVIHFAAQSHVQNSFEDSISFTKDNVLGTNTLLEACRKYGNIKRFIHVSTDEVYGESMTHVDELHKTEHSILCPTNPYAASKAGAELIAQSYYHSFQFPVIITRGNNVYGKNQYPEKLIPKFIYQLKSNQKVTIQGQGDSVRAFLHAYDTAKAFEVILEKGQIGEIYNIGCDENMEYSVLDVAKILIQKIKKTTDYDKWIEYIEDRPFNDKRYYISNKKLKDLGWNIEIGLEEGLHDLIFDDYKINLMDMKLTRRLENKTSFFGNWIHNIDHLKEKFISNKPFDHVIIPNFLNEEFANQIFSNFPENIEHPKWHKYYNPIELKYANDDLSNFPRCIKKYFYILSMPEVIDLFQKLSNIQDLEFDPYLHGAGLHIHPRNGRLDLHLDYEKHPKLEKERRLNIILYMSKGWKEEWNGSTELWNSDVTECAAKSKVEFNTAIIFRTNEQSWHGMPEKLTCPLNVYRKSLAYYYISPLVTKKEEVKFGNNEEGYRVKAAFRKRPQDPYCPVKEKLYEIRPHRLITEDDLNKLGYVFNEHTS